ncbi:uncharacterized protein [Tenebrio molitor]|uniref:uncharacterized protein isoform X5 n=1 Tax=Tenebrio molitor TaxID=7067 RepID=UPI003624997C
MADWSLPRKPRKSNFSTDEVDVLVDSVRSYYNVLYGKFAKRATNRWIRQKAWMDILKKVNGVSIEKRTLQEVKNKWKKCQYALKEKAVHGTLADDAGDSSLDDMDSMPLQERLSKVAAQEKIAAGAQGQVLKSQPLSPTKLKVTRQSPKAAPKVAEPPQSPVNEEMCLRWNSHHSNMQKAFPSILSKEQYVDVTLAAEGKTLKCHRLILSSCSPYFEEILSGISPYQHPVLFMRDIPFWILKSLCDFMYAGEVHIFQNKLEELLTVAEALKIKGLAGKSTPPENHEEQSGKHDNTSNNNNNNNNKEVKKKHHQHEKERPQHLPPPLKKNPVFTQTNNFESTSHDYDNDDLLDPLDLLEPLYEEAAEEKKPTSTVVRPKENKYQYQPMKKPFTRRLRKRKYSEQRDPSPPPVFSFRKGTRSRPNVKIPKYYHTDYTNPPKQMSNAQTDPLLEVDEIKTEPIDVEDNLIVYSDEDHYMENSLDPANCNSPIIITSAKPSLPQQDKFRKIKLSKPIITEVHTIKESNTTPGGLEVIKITVQQPEEPNAKRGVQGTDPLQEAANVKEAVVEPAVVIAQGEEVAQSETPQEGAAQGEGQLGAGAAEEETEVNVAEVTTAETVEEADLVQGPAEVNLIEVVTAEVNLEHDAPEVNLVEGASEVTFVESAPEATLVEDAPEANLVEGNTTETNLVEGTAETTDASEAVDCCSREVDSTEQTPEQEAGPEEVANNNSIEENEEQLHPEIQIEDVRTTCLEEMENEAEEERRTASLDHLEKEAMNVANAINKENQAGPPDIE